MTTTADDIEQHRQSDGRFGAHTHSDPGVSLQAPEMLLWLVVGDDHESRVYEAASAEEAEEMAREDFADQYDADPDDCTADVVAAFRGDIDDDREDWEWVADNGTANEQRARTILDEAEI